MLDVLSCAVRQTMRFGGTDPHGFAAARARPFLLGMLSSFLPDGRSPAEQERLLRTELLAPTETWADVDAWARDFRLRAWLRRDALNRWYRGSEVYRRAAASYMTAAGPTPAGARRARATFALDDWQWGREFRGCEDLAQRRLLEALPRAPAARRRRRRGAAGGGAPARRARRVDRHWSYAALLEAAGCCVAGRRAQRLLREPRAVRGALAECVGRSRRTYRAPPAAARRGRRGGRRRPPPARRRARRGRRRPDAPAEPVRVAELGAGDGRLARALRPRARGRIARGRDRAARERLEGEPPAARGGGRRRRARRAARLPPPRCGATGRTSCSSRGCRWASTGAPRSAPSRPCASAPLRARRPSAPPSRDAPRPPRVSLPRAALSLSPDLLAAEFRDDPARTARAALFAAPRRAARVFSGRGVDHVLVGEAGGGCCSHSFPAHSANPAFRDDPILGAAPRAAPAGAAPAATARAARAVRAAPAVVARGQRGGPHRPAGRRAGRRRTRAPPSRREEDGEGAFELEHLSLAPALAPRLRVVRRQLAHGRVPAARRARATPRTDADAAQPRHAGTRRERSGPAGASGRRAARAAAARPLASRASVATARADRRPREPKPARRSGRRGRGWRGGPW